MLELLRIRNLAIIDTAEIIFHPGLTILSGETGAGKSIILDAIGLLLGSKASTDRIRLGESEAVIEGVFTLTPAIIERLEAAGLPHESGELVIKRSLHRTGKHRLTIQGELAPLATLASITQGLVDICSQHEHQSLLHPTTQLELLDRSASIDTRALESRIQTWRKEHRDIEQLEQQQREALQKRDFLKFQIDDIDKAHLEPNEDTRLTEEKHRLLGLKQQVERMHAVRILLDENSVLTHLHSAAHRIKPVDQGIHESLTRALLEIEDVTGTLDRLIQQTDLSEERLATMTERLCEIGDLKRKYGPSIEAIEQKKNALHQELIAMESMDLKERRKAWEEESELLHGVCAKISILRQQAASTLSLEVTKTLRSLHMEEAVFTISVIKNDQLQNAGFDSVSYLVLTNAGETMRPLAKIASGGELSRILLAMRHVIAGIGGIGVYIFDEIDAGMGGRAAFEVGKKLQSVSRDNQVLCITHLPQVAAFADNHLHIQKHTSKERTFTEVKDLSIQERYEELACMLGGPSQTKKGIDNARELIDCAESVKIQKETTHTKLSAYPVPQ